MGTGLCPTNKRYNCEPGSPELETFLREVETTLIDQLNSTKHYHESEKSKAINSLQKDLKLSSNVVLPTDKTNSFFLADIDTAESWIQNHINKDATKTTRSRVIEAYKQGEEIFESIENLLANHERAYLREALKLKAIPCPQILIKDHKKPTLNPNYPSSGPIEIYPTRLVIPAGNFTAPFAKLGYKTIKNILEKL